MQGRNFRVRSLSWLSGFLLLAVLVMLNAVLARAATRIDLTEEGLYTLSDGSRKILGELEDPATIKVFWADVPVRFDHTKRYVAALLEEMGEASNGLVQTSWIDMSEDSGQEEAAELGVQPYIFQAAHGKEVRQAKGYMSLVIEMGEEKPRALDVLFQLQDQLEYLVVATIFQRSRLTQPVIGMVSNKPHNPFGGGRQPGQFTEFEAMLAQTFGTSARTYLDLDSPVPEDVDVLIVARPRNLTPEQVYRFEQFLLRGGRGILLEDPADLENVLGRAAQQAEPHVSGFEDWLTHLGVTVERGVVADFNHPSGFPRSRAEFVRYSYWPQVQRANMAEDNPVMRNTPPMTLYWPAALSVDQAKQEQQGRTVTLLATSSEGGYRRGDLTGLARADESKDGKLLEAVPLIVLLEGPMTSLWLGKPVPGTEPAADEGAVPGLPGGGPLGPPDDLPEDAPKKDAAAGSPDGAAAGSPDGDAPAPEAPKKDAPKKDAPKKDAPKEGDGDEDADAEEAEGPVRLEKGDIRLLVVGDADFIDDRLVRAYVTRVVNGNVGPGFVMGAAEWMSGSDELLALRARATNPRNLDEVDEDTQKMVKHVNLWAIPLLVILAGLTMFFVRRSS